MLKKDLQPEFVLSLCEDSEKVMQFLADVKWETGFVCRGCGHTNFCSGKTYASRRCTKCKKEESATANTIFHNCKFPLNKAFTIIYSVCFQKRKMTVGEMSDELGLNPMTCWKFRTKIRKCVRQHQNNPNDDVDVMDILMEKKD